MKFKSEETKDLKGFKHKTKRGENYFLTIFDDSGIKTINISNDMNFNTISTLSIRVFSFFAISFIAKSAINTIIQIYTNPSYFK